MTPRQTGHHGWILFFPFWIGTACAPPTSIIVELDLQACQVPEQLNRAEVWVWANGLEISHQSHALTPTKRPSAIEVLAGETEDETVIIQVAGYLDDHLVDQCDPVAARMVPGRTRHLNRILSCESDSP